MQDRTKVKVKVRETRGGGERKDEKSRNQERKRGREGGCERQRDKESERKRAGRTNELRLVVLRRTVDVAIPRCDGRCSHEARQSTEHRLVNLVR